MQVGALDRRLTIQAFTTTRDPESNEEIQTWADLATVWANRRDVSAREFFAAGARNTEQVSLFTIRWRPGLTSTLRVIQDGQTFGITGVSEIGRRQYLALQAKAVNSNATA
jgi:SPP1 family predicted phage head-tail adaptor